MEELKNRVDKLEKEFQKTLKDSGGLADDLGRRIERAKGDIDKKYDYLISDVADLRKTVYGDTETPGISKRFREAELLLSDLHTMSLKINGDGTESNRGLLSRFESTEQITQSARTLVQVIGAIASVVGISFVSFFWNQLQEKHQEHKQQIFEIEKRTQALEKDLASSSAKSDERNRWAERVYGGNK